MAKALYTCEQVIKAIEDNKGMVYLAADALGCSHVTVYNYIKKHPTVRQAFERASGRQGDKTEQKLYDAIERGESWAIAFYLKTKGKDRGYTERQELQYSGDMSITLDWGDNDHLNGDDA